MILDNEDPPQKPRCGDVPDPPWADEELVNGVDKRVRRPKRKTKESYKKIHVQF